MESWSIHDLLVLLTYSYIIRCYKKRNHQGGCWHWSKLLPCCKNQFCLHTVCATSIFSYNSFCTLVVKCTKYVSISNTFSIEEQRLGWLSCNVKLETKKFKISHVYGYKKNNLLFWNFVEFKSNAHKTENECGHKLCQLL